MTGTWNTCNRKIREVGFSQSCTMKAQNPYQDIRMNIEVVRGAVNYGGRQN